jgi:FtsP/CotA-like multicopper oxidase with cupredoxin domain
MSARLRSQWSLLLVAATLLAACGGAAQPALPAAAPTPTPSSLAAPALSPAMAHMMASLPDEGVPAATVDQGNQPLAHRDEEGVKIFELTAKPVRWDFGGGVQQVAWTYNGMVPGPLLRVTEGDQVRIVVRNELPDDTTIHWHGIEAPNAMDGVPGMTQDPVAPGETFVYEFEAKPAGTFWYHSHVESDIQIGVGLHGAFIIDPKTPEPDPPAVDRVLILNEWRFANGQTYASMPMTGMDPNYFTINGKFFPYTEEIRVKTGDRVRLRFIAAGQFVHPMHLHGFPFKIVATDGHAVPEVAQLTKDTVLVSPGERYDIEFTAAEPGMWMIHCHISHHTTNDGEEPGGLMMTVHVE